MKVLILILVLSSLVFASCPVGEAVFVQGGECEPAMAVSDIPGSNFELVKKTAKTLIEQEEGGFSSGEKSSFISAVLGLLAGLFS